MRKEEKMYLKFKPGDKVLFGKEIGVVDSVNITRTATYYGVQINGDIKPVLENYLLEYKKPPENIIKNAEIEVLATTLCPYCDHYQNHCESLGVNIFDHVGEIFEVECDRCGSKYKIKLVKEND